MRRYLYNSTDPIKDREIGPGLLTRWPFCRASKRPMRHNAFVGVGSYSGQLFLEVHTIHSAAASAVALAAYLANRTHSHLGIAGLIGSIVVGTVVYLGLLVVAGQLGRRDLDILKNSALDKGFPA
jgi:hypothetical protein